MWFLKITNIQKIMVKMNFLLLYDEKLIPKAGKIFSLA